MMSSSLSRPIRQANLATAQQNGDLAAEAACLIALGNIAQENEEYELAQGLYMQGGDLYTRLNDAVGQIQALRRLGKAVIDQDLEDLEVFRRGEAFLNQALSLAQSCGNHDEEGYVWMDWADLIDPVEEGKRRRLNIEKALSCFEQSGNIEGQANATVQLARMDASKFPRENRKRALKLYKRAIELYTPLPSSPPKALAWKWYGRHLIEWNTYEEGYPYLTQSLTLFQQLNEKFEEFHLLDYMGKASMQANNYAEARNRLHQALTLCDPEAPLSTMDGIVLCLCDISLAEKNYREAEQDLDRLIAFCDHPHRTSTPYYQSKKAWALKTLTWVQALLE